ncbi:MAG TPA: sulfur oxidation c-type cytochrome SoxA [Burkholderiales bacterium]|nr:sulfur oxidation c-type cytochrome SoxA [Burkholderiales bacterium]
MRFSALLLLLVTGFVSAEIPLAERRSGYEFMSRETRAMQDDDAANPGMFWVLDGEALFRRRESSSGSACMHCHSDLKGVAARYPARDVKSGRLMNLEQRINACRIERMNAKAFAYESRELLSLTVFIAKQSRGVPIEVQKSNAGEALYRQRQGQLNLSCAQCHDERWDRKLAGTPIAQGHPSGYPVYRLEWQGLGSLQRRLRNCLSGMRAESYPYGAPELVELEQYLMWRARGMKVESPGVRP